ncbi:cytochrome P450 [Aspergillus karnatakaensis]|uniref:cytochrome P450 n=1 Tax=Aspergillus karnatakaensis TaxID=1810916 RepID=UPI003CCE37FA
MAMSSIIRGLDLLATNLFQTIACIILVLFTVNLYRALTDPLFDIPGPFLARFTRLWLAREYSSGGYQRTNIALHKQYGPIVRIAPNQYSIDSPTAIKTLYGHGSSLHKGDWYIPWGHPEWPNLFNILDPHTHGAARRKVAKPYSMTSLLGYEPSVNECTVLLKSKLNEFATLGQSVDMGRWFQFYAFDVIGQITFSRRFGFLQSGQDIQGLIRMLDTMNNYTAVIGLFVRAHNILGEIEAIKAKPLPSSPSGPVDFVTKLLQERQHGSSRNVIDRDINVSAFANVLAGTDTTSISLSGILYHLLRSPQTLATLRKELEVAKEQARVSSPITFQEARALPFLEAVIKESLRLHSAAAFTFPRVVSKGGLTLAGRVFPEKTTVGVNPWVAHRNTTIFGPGADEFRPQRWIDQDKSVLAEYESNFLTFGQGARTCIGKNISYLEMYKVIPELVLGFDFELVNSGEWKTHTAWFSIPVGFQCRVTPRNKKVAV